MSSNMLIYRCLRLGKSNMYGDVIPSVRLFMTWVYKGRVYQKLLILIHPLQTNLFYLKSPGLYFEDYFMIIFLVVLPFLQIKTPALGAFTLIPVSV